MNNKIEREWTTKAGLKAAVVFNTQGGHRCGYVFLPETHDKYIEPIYKEYEFHEKMGKIMQYHEMYPHICVHGDITYGQHTRETNLYPIETHDEGMWLGFDAAHYDDCPDFDTWKTLIENEEDQFLYDTYKNMSHFNEKKVRDLNYMINECEQLAEQLVEGDKNG